MTHQQARATPRMNDGANVTITVHCSNKGSLGILGNFFFFFCLGRPDVCSLFYVSRCLLMFVLLLV